MTTLDTTNRCNRCGIRLREEEFRECPNCRADLAQVGGWSELLEWERTRQASRTQYLWLKWVFGWGSLVALGIDVGLFLRGAPWSALLAVVVSSLAAGYCMGQWYWRSAEREYAKTQHRG